jgi:hypothetical protein
MARTLLNIFIVSACTNILRIKVRRSLGCSTTVEGGVGSTVRSTSSGALEVFFAVFLGALALLLFVIALTEIGNNIGFK